MQIELTAMERLARVVEIMAEGVLALVVNTAPFSYLTDNDLRAEQKLKSTDILCAPCGRVD